jgi:hypothetical protein
VHEPVLVRERQRPRDLETELERPPNRERPTAFDDLLQRLTVDELEDDELPPVLLAAVDDRDDVRVYCSWSSLMATSRSSSVSCAQ